MNKNIILLLLSLFFLSACSEKINEEHQEYLTSKGWEIKKFTEKEQYILNLPEELLENYEASGVLFIRDYIGKSVTSYQYELKETDKEGSPLKAILIEHEGNTIGGYGLLNNWSPGIFNLNDKKRLLEEDIITY